MYGYFVGILKIWVINFIFLGVGKIYKDVVFVRVIYVIFVVCGIYYFEVWIVSKGCDGWVVSLFLLL